MGKAEILQRIKDAEAKVRVMTQEAEEKRKQLQAEGKRKALEMTATAETDLKRRLDAQTAAAKSTVSSRKGAVMEQGHKRADEMAAQARKKMASAKEFVLSEFERAVDA